MSAHHCIGNPCTICYPPTSATRQYESLAVATPASTDAAVLKELRAWATNPTHANAEPENNGYESAQRDVLVILDSKRGAA